LLSLNDFAALKNTSAGYLRVYIQRRRKAGKPLVWRGYKFVMPGTEWLAIEIDPDFPTMKRRP